MMHRVGCCLKRGVRDSSWHADHNNARSGCDGASGLAGWGGEGGGGGPPSAEWWAERVAAAAPGGAFGPAAATAAVGRALEREARAAEERNRGALAPVRGGLGRCGRSADTAALAAAGARGAIAASATAVGALKALGQKRAWADELEEMDCAPPPPMYD